MSSTGNKMNEKQNRQTENPSPKRSGGKIDMLNGPLPGKILLFALPLAVTGVLQQLFNAADVAVVGQLVDKNAMAAVGSSAPIVGLMLNLFIGIALGTNVVIARFTGSKNPEAIHRAVHTSILVALICGIVMAAIGCAVASPLLHLLEVPENIFPMSLAYLRIYMCGMPAILLYNFEAAIYRSQGDTRTPLYCLIIAGVLNVGLNVFFVSEVHMTADGVALATVISNVVSSGAMFIGLLRTKLEIRVRFPEFRIDPKVLKPILQIGVPAGLQGCVFSVSNLCVQSAVNSLGPDVMAASAAAFNLEIFAYYILNSFGQAATTFTGQNYAAHQFDRCRKILRTALVMDWIATSILAALLLLFATPLLRLFNSDPAVLHYGRIRMFYLLLPEVVNVMIEVFSGAMRGLGHSLGPALATFIGVCGTRIFWIFVIFPLKPTMETLMFCYPLSWTITAALLVTLYLIGRRRWYGEKNAAAA